MNRENFVTQVFSPDTDNSDDDDDDDFLSTAKDQTKYLSQEGEDEKMDPTSFLSLDTNITSKKSKKVITKAAVAKKLAKMNIQVNTRVEFNEEGEQMLDPTKQQVSKTAQEVAAQEESGINIDKLKEIMKDEDLIDKKLHAQLVK